MFCCFCVQEELLLVDQMKLMIVLVDFDFGVQFGFMCFFFNDYDLICFLELEEVFKYLKVYLNVVVIVFCYNLFGCGGMVFLCVVEGIVFLVFWVMFIGEIVLEVIKKVVNEGYVFKYFEKLCQKEELIFFVEIVLLYYW